MSAPRIIVRTVLGILLAVAFLSSIAFAQGSFSHVLSFQGRLCATDGKPLPDGPYAVSFAMYAAESGGASMWTEVQGVTQIGGVFTAFLGVVTPFPAGLFTGGDRWLGISVGADPEMPTRFRLTPSPWAIYAADSAHAALADQATDADKVDGIHANTTPTGKQLLALDVAAQWPLSTIPQGSGSGLDSDRVDNLHADSTPTANQLLALDGKAEWPLSTIKQGSGSTLDADTVDTFHAGSAAAANRLLTLDGTAKWPLATIPQGSGSNLDADKVDTFHAGSTAAANRLLTLDGSARWPLTTIPQGSGSNLNADMVDTFHASVAPTASQLLALDGSAKWPLATIPQGSGSNLDADKVDTFHAGSTAAPNRLLTLDGSAKWPLATIPQGAGSTLDADKVDNIHASVAPTANYLLPLDGTGKFPTSVLPTGLWTAAGGDIYRATGNVGIGTPTPGYTLHVVSAGARAVSGETSLGTGNGVYGRNSSASGDGPGVYGEHANADYYGVGVKGVGGWVGVTGSVEPTGNHSYMGTSGSVSGGSGTNTGLYGYAYGAGTNYGVYGYAGGEGTNYGVCGYAVGSAPNYAGYFSGDVRITGELTEDYSGTPARATPIAYGVIDSLGNVVAAGSTSNFTCVWNAGTQAYEITILGENYFWTSYVTTVTPMAGPYTVSTGSVSGKLLVSLRNSAGANVQSYFQFVTYKP